MNLHERLKGKVIVICGGGAGTGKASALRFAAEGAKVVVGGRRMEKLEAVVGEIRENGGDAAPFEFDMNDYAGIDDLIAFAEATFGRIDGLHNIAGNPVAGATDFDFMTVSEETWKAQLQSHMLSYAYAARKAVPVMLKHGGGAIVNTSSRMARSADVSRIGYQTAKSGLETLTRHIAHRFGKEGIRCNTICYGLILTETALEYLPQSFQDQELSEIWSPRLGQPNDAAALAALLFSDEGSWIQGQVIDLNGGRLLGP